MRSTPAGALFACNVAEGGSIGVSPPTGKSLFQM